MDKFELPARDKKRIVTGIYWNTWFTGDENPPANVLEVGKDYTVNVDLSASNYPELRSFLFGISTNATANQYLGALISSGAKSARLTIKPIVSEGSGLEIIGDEPADMLLNIEKIRTPDFAAADAYVEADNPLPVPEGLRAGSISFAIHTTASGCPRIALAIFNRMTPIDHLVQRVVIKDKDGEQPPCAKNLEVSAQSLSGGLDALRETGLSSEDSVVGDAALYIFDAEKDQNLAVFVDGRKDVKKAVYGWRTKQSVVEFLRGSSFEKRISNARAEAALNHTGGYVLAAQDLWDELFAATNESKDAAKSGEAALKELVKASATPPVIVVRVASSVKDGRTHSLSHRLQFWVPKGIALSWTSPSSLSSPWQSTGT